MNQNANDEIDLFFEKWIRISKSFVEIFFQNSMIVHIFFSCLTKNFEKKIFSEKIHDLKNSLIFDDVFAKINHRFKNDVFEIVKFDENQMLQLNLNDDKFIMKTKKKQMKQFRIRKKLVFVEFTKSLSNVDLIEKNSKIQFCKINVKKIFVQNVESKLQKIDHSRA